MDWFLSYVLKFYMPAGIAATRGSICHSFLETCAISKIHRQQGGELLDDPILGPKSVGSDYEPDKWFDAVLEHYKVEDSHVNITNSDIKKCWKGIEKVLDHEMSPYNLHEVVAPELLIHQEIDQDWALFEQDGEQKRLMIKGFVDAVFRDEDGNLNFIDYKSSSRLECFSTGKTKTVINMHEDPQLVFYWWAANRMFPEDHVIGHIWFFNLDTFWTLGIDENDAQLCFDKVGERIEKMRALKVPRCRYEMDKKQSWKCKQFCPFSKMVHPTVQVPYNPMRHRFDPIDGKACICDTIKQACEQRDILTVVENCQNKDSKR